MKVQRNETSADQVGKLRHAMHELNNALTPVLANAQLARVMIHASPTEAEDALDDVVEAATRANALVTEMREIVLSLQEELPIDAPNEEVSRG